MAYDFVRANVQNLRVSSAPVTGAPCTIACWYRIDSTDLEIFNGLITVDSTVNSSRISLSYNGGPAVNRAVQLFVADANNQFTQTSNYDTNISADTWYHAAGVLFSSSTHLAYFNGLPANTNNTDKVLTNLDGVTLSGRYNYSTNSVVFSMGGGLADVGIWNVELTADEIASLAKGMACNKVRPQSLVFYAPLVRELIDVRGGLSITNDNATVAEHPRIYQ